jgi:hypothetical protein
VNVDEDGYYTLTSKSESYMDLYGYLYTDNFNPNNPSMNLLLENNYGCGYSQFKLTAHLESYTDYILVVTTYSQNTTGAFSILVSGPNDAVLKPIRKLI